MCCRCFVSVFGSLLFFSFCWNCVIVFCFVVRLWLMKVVKFFLILNSFV